MKSSLKGAVLQHMRAGNLRTQRLGCATCNRSSVGGTHGPVAAGRKAFFFEKKKQKTFTSLSRSYTGMRLKT
jgi:hypothetical protein